jgi:MoxR-like ATPase
MVDIEVRVLPKKRIIKEDNQEPVYRKPDYSRQIDYIERITNNMLSGSSGKLLITGDTGIGKTSFVKQFAKLFGFPTIVIEVPHIVEEHLLSIPFLVFDHKGRKIIDQNIEADKEDGKTKVEVDKISNLKNNNEEDKNEFGDPTYVSGTSYLISQLKQINKVPDSQWPAEIQNADELTKNLITEFERKYPGDIDRIRQKYSRILFFDEFWRTTTPEIRNVLRSVLLQGKIGSQIIPPGTYTLYASNIKDVEGTIETSKSQSYKVLSHIDFKSPSKEEWLSFTISNSIKGGVKFKKEVVDAFDQELSDEHISYNDFGSLVRTSPRRWSEILLYINNSFPFSTPEDAGIVKTTLKRQFRSDSDVNAISKLYETLNGILDRLIIKSGLNPKQVKETSPAEWRKVMAHQVMSKFAIGENRKYVPVVQSLPGLGKTALGHDFETKFNLRYIEIDCPTLTRDSVVGIPIPKSEEDKTKSVQFSEPPLYKDIMNQIEKQNEAYRQRLIENEKLGTLGNKTAEQVWQDFQKQKYKYLVYFDELNRVRDVSIYNSLRRIILEKEFNPKYKLPDECLLIGAINPFDVNTVALSKHFRDSIDLIDAEPSWKEYQDYLNNILIPRIQKSNNIDDDTLTTVKQLLNKFSEVFGNSNRGLLKEFYISIGETDSYISPRDYESLFRELCIALERQINYFSRESSKYNDKDIKDIIGRKLFEVIEGKILGNLDVDEIEGNLEDYFENIKEFITNQVEFTLKKKTAATGLSGLLDQHLKNKTLLADNTQLEPYLQGVQPNDLQIQLADYLTRKYSNSIDSKMFDDLENIVKGFKEAIDENGIETRFNDYFYNGIKDFISSISKSVNDDREFGKRANQLTIMMIGLLLR